MLQRMPTSTLVPLFVLASMVILAPTIWAHPYQLGHGAAHVGVVSSQNLAPVEDADGLHVQAVTASMDVPRRSGTPGTTVQDSNRNGTLEDEPIGHNTRPIQLGAEAPPQAVGGREFYAIGYTAGCGAPGIGPSNGCTGVTPTGGVYKRVYVDGQGCNYLDRVCRYGYYQYGAISAGQVVNYQMQRNIINNTGTWRAWADGVHINSRSNLLMSHANPSVGSESVTTQGVHQSIDMVQNNYRSISFHRNGTASSNPPGTANYQSMFWTSLVQPHAPACTAGRQTTTAGGEQRITGLTIAALRS